MLSVVWSVFSCSCLSLGLLMQLHNHNTERKTDGSFAARNRLPAASEGCLWIFRLAATLNKRDLIINISDVLRVPE